MNRDDLIAYLVVLGKPIESFSLEDQRAGAKAICGCLVRLEEQLEKLGGDPVMGHIESPHEKFRWSFCANVLLYAIRKREDINGRLPCGHPDLVEANDDCATEIYKILEFRPWLEQNSHLKTE